MADMVQTDVLIVGAGLAGLNAARVLQTAGLSVVVVDKGRGIGGRMATRRIDSGLADHGAQFFTVRHETFRSMVDVWIASGLVFEWSRGWSDGSLAESRDGHPRYAVRGGMNALTKHLAEGIDARADVKITQVTGASSGWRAEDAAGGTYHARAVLLTPPVPQSLALLDAGRVTLDAGERAALEAVHYEPCITAMMVIDGDVRLPAPGAIQRPHAKIFWIGDNQRKGISERLILTAQASSPYSQDLWTRTEDEILTALRVDMMPILGENATISAIELKKWKYAQVTATYPERTLIASGLPDDRVLAFAGDGFGGPRVEGAVMSGITAGQALAARLR
jgi:predicted NAD/FAD-dependent oxidoreductase